MGSGAVRVFGLMSGQTIVGEVLEPGLHEGGMIVLREPGLVQVVQGPKGPAIAMVMVAFGDLISGFAEFMERFLLPKTAVLYEAPASARAVNLYFQYCANLREQLSGIRVVHAMPNLPGNGRAN